MPRVEHIAVAPGAPAPLPVCDRWRQLCETAQGTHVSQALIIYAVWSLLLSRVPCGAASACIFGMSGVRQWSGVLLGGGGGGGGTRGGNGGQCLTTAFHHVLKALALFVSSAPEPCEPLHGCREMINGAETCHLSGAFGLIKSFFFVVVVGLFFFPCRVELPFTSKVVLFANYRAGRLSIIPSTLSAEKLSC